MKKLLAIVEDGKGNVVGALTSEGEITLPKDQQVPREQLKHVAGTLAAAYDVALPAGFIPPAPSPAPEGTGSSPEGAD